MDLRQFGKYNQFKILKQDAIKEVTRYVGIQSTSCHIHVYICTYIFFTTPYLFPYLKYFIAEFCENLSYFVNFCYVTSQNSAEEVASG